MIPNNFIEFYGDQTRWFFGSVVDVMDPEKLGRVKVRVFGVYDSKDEENKNLIADNDLPWAQIVVPVTTGIHEGKGQNLGLLVGTQVFGMFLDGKSSQLPMVIGTVPKKGDKNSKAEDNYPDNKVYETETGHYKEYDDTAGAERIKESHKSGTFYEMMADGSITTYITKDNYSIVLGDESVTIVGKVTINVGGDVDLTAGGDVSINAKNIKLNS
jgi:hypothetical protein